MTAEEIRIRILENHSVTRRTEKITVLRTLCGLQSQYIMNVRHALLIRCKERPAEESWNDGVIQNWTLRGSLHAFSTKDLGLFLHGERKNKPWTGDGYITAHRKRFFAEQILRLTEEGISEHEALVKHCRALGMTETEERSVFDKKGGTLRELALRGYICAQAVNKKSYCLCPDFIPMETEAAETEIMRRYFTYYGPASVCDAAYFFGYSQNRVKRLMQHLPLKSAKTEGVIRFYIDRGTSGAGIPECLFLTGYDPLMLGYKKAHNLFLPAKQLQGKFNGAGMVFPALLYKGVVIGHWKMKEGKLTVTLFQPVTARVCRCISSHAEALFNDLRAIRWEQV